MEKIMIRMLLLISFGIHCFYTVEAQEWGGHPTIIRRTTILGAIQTQTTAPTAIQTQRSTSGSVMVTLTAITQRSTVLWPGHIYQSTSGAPAASITPTATSTSQTTKITTIPTWGGGSGSSNPASSSSIIPTWGGGSTVSSIPSSSLPVSTIPQYVEKRITASFVAPNSFSDVAGNLDTWTSRSQNAVAAAGRVQSSRITNMQLTSGSINFTFIIAKSTSDNQITTDEAKDNIEAEVKNRRLKILGPQNQELSPDPTFTWQYTDEVVPTPQNLKDDDDSGFDDIYYIFIICGAFIVVVIMAAGIATCCLTTKSKAKPTGHYNDTYEEHIIVTPEQSPKLSERSSGPESEAKPDPDNSATFEY